GIVKLAVIGTMLFALLWPERDRLDSLVFIDMARTLPMVQTLSLKLLRGGVAVLGVVAALDYLSQYQQWVQRQEMSLHEVNDEFKSIEGAPPIKQRIRQLRQSRMRRRMMAAVPNATVVITNPTHFAVALQYERGMNAPLCVAKGVDAFALRIREVA